MAKHKPYERTIYVMLECREFERIPEKEVKFENIEEDIQGRDVLTFTCPFCKKIHKSLRVG